MRLTKKRYLLGFAIVTLLLWLVRLLFPQVAEPNSVSATEVPIVPKYADADMGADKPVTKNEKSSPHPILSVPSYRETFPDTNAIQMVAARRWGVSPVKNRADAEGRMRELVYIGSSPYYHVDPLRQSIPYLVPRAAVLLQDIGQAFFDSLYVKGIPLHRFIVTSVLRTKDDVARLRNFNGNATENSCHLYGTTFDICYNRYQTVEDPDGEHRRQVRNDTLKYVLSEVLRDMRSKKRCYIKYEVKQGCFHMTVR
ncbi:MAG: hypothetical protein IJP74_04570 [Prevotella sp.]|nr:hypothetical protein [Prevotella sp.]